MLIRLPHLVHHEFRLDPRLLLMELEEVTDISFMAKPVMGEVIGIVGMVRADRFRMVSSRDRGCITHSQCRLEQCHFHCQPLREVVAKVDRQVKQLGMVKAVSIGITSPVTTMEYGDPSHFVRNCLHPQDKQTGQLYLPYMQHQKNHQHGRGGQQQHRRNPLVLAALSVQQNLEGT